MPGDHNAVASQLAQAAFTDSGHASAHLRTLCIRHLERRERDHDTHDEASIDPARRAAMDEVFAAYQPAGENR